MCYVALLKVECFGNKTRLFCLRNFWICEKKVYPTVELGYHATVVLFPALTSFHLLSSHGCYGFLQWRLLDWQYFVTLLLGMVALSSTLMYTSRSRSWKTGLHLRKMRRKWTPVSVPELVFIAMQNYTVLECIAVLSFEGDGGGAAATNTEWCANRWCHGLSLTFGRYELLICAAVNTYVYLVDPILMETSGVLKAEERTLRIWVFWFLWPVLIE